MVVRGTSEIRRIESCNQGRDIIKVKNTHDDIWQIDMIKRVGTYYRK